MTKRKKKQDPLSLGFRLSGKSFEPTTLPVAVARAVKVLKHLSFKELLTTRQLAQLSGLQKMSFSHYVGHPALSVYKYNIGQTSRGNMWGSVRTMRELKRQLEKA